MVTHGQVIVIPRWLLTAKYALFVLLGGTVAWAGLPTLDWATWTGYVSVWSMLVAVSALVAAVGSVTDRWEPIERWASVGLVSLLSVYLVAAAIRALSGEGSGAGLIVVLIITLLPAARAGWLIARTGRRG